MGREWGYYVCLVHCRDEVCAGGGGVCHFRRIALAEWRKVRAGAEFVLPRRPEQGGGPLPEKQLPPEDRDSTASPAAGGLESGAPSANAYSRGSGRCSSSGSLFPSGAPAAVHQQPCSFSPDPRPLLSGFSPSTPPFRLPAFKHAVFENPLNADVLFGTPAGWDAIYDEISAVHVRASMRNSNPGRLDQPPRIRVSTPSRTPSRTAASPLVQDPVEDRGVPDDTQMVSV